MCDYLYYYCRKLKIITYIIQLYLHNNISNFLFNMYANAREINYPISNDIEIFQRH